MQRDREPRVTVLSWLLWALILCALIGGLVYTSPARADTYSMSDAQGNTVTLTDKPCEGLLPWMHMYQAEMFYKGKKYTACWFPLREVVIVIDDSGDITPIEQVYFRKDKAI